MQTMQSLELWPSPSSCTASHSSCCPHAGPRSVTSVDESNADDLNPPGSPTAGAQSESQAGAPSAVQTQQAVQRLTQRVARLKASRDKLLSEVDGQSAELDRLHISISALEQVRACALVEVSGCES